jgi:pilus assembly protein Flp/PilA
LPQHCDAGAFILALVFGNRQICCKFELLQLSHLVLRSPNKLHLFRRVGNHGLGSQGLGMRKVLTQFVKDEAGATAIEYGLIAAGIAVAIIAVVQGIGTNLTTTFGSISTALK